MEKKEFAQMMAEKIKEQFGDGYEVSVVEVRKNNDTVLTGITLKADELCMAPTVYVDDFYDEVLRGRDLKEVARQLAAAFKCRLPKQEIDISFYRDYDLVKSQICFRLVSAERNAEALKELSSVPFLDMAVTFFVPFHDPEMGEGSIAVRKEHAEQWGVTEKELLAQALKNTPAIYPAQHLSMMKILDELNGMCKCTDEEEEAPRYRDEPMSVLTNEKRNYGAAAILYPGMLKILSERIGGSFYVLPSSVHETILVREGMDYHDLSCIVAEVNANNVGPQDYLSDSVYYYDAKEKVLIVCGRNDFGKWSGSVEELGAKVQDGTKN